ncbi:hypothetical protein BGW36DRAFT_296535 [Talaromyces proteolyticus]|uniref:Uncharacterized protein n=1 Tax=Talaromyces proteolyticus TaxID=1131652 RepID=A0AAD4KPI0_9EURO|nr:uncharacterized protein BGW36DRAFT_296535 [Talaromyces proteolyticus]KAH8697463.1 hypothetical protein BGW36DRAFT_296535 [Talaromyces proteolyticus]
MPVSFSSNEDAPTHNNNNDQVRPTGSAGTASLEALSTIQQTGRTAGFGAVVDAPGSQRANAVDIDNAPSARQLTKAEADRLYEENIEEEYAKREGGA